MIAKLRGIIDSKGEDWLVIDVNGVGYLVEASARTLSALPGPGEAAEVFTRMLVSENAIRLLGFASAAERDWYALLAEVQGVGPKVALALLSALSPAELTTAVSMADAAMLTRAQGVGPKLARRICSELRDRVAAMAGAPSEVVAAAAEVSGLPAQEAPPAARDAVSALVNLGYTKAQAGTAVAAVIRETGEDGDVARLIRLALKKLAES
jgi:Holliday junction DNA helicase RuvA